MTRGNGMAANENRVRRRRGAKEELPMPLRMTMAGAALLLALSGPALATTVHFKAQLKGAAEVPSAKSPGRGELVATLDTDTKLLTYLAKYSGLKVPSTMAHFHVPPNP